MLNLYKDNDLIINDKSELSFTIAKAYEDLGDYEKSFKYFDQANKLKNNNKYNFSREEKLFRNIKKFFDSNELDRKSTRLNSSHKPISYAVFCLKKKKKKTETFTLPSKGSELNPTPYV